jgi:hypothetical protein
MPSASIAAAIVFAVNIPPHAPAPGHACRTMSRRASSSIRFAMNSPYEVSAETMSSGRPSRLRPGRIVPPYTMIDGRFTRPIAITQPGMFLSQPGIEMFASYHCAPITVSIESAIRSRDWSEYFIPSVPIDVPSETPTVLNRRPTRPASFTPSFTAAARSSRCMLHGLPSNQTLAMPT